ncbi:MAG: recombinase RecT [Selenomonadaceae bacterium]
MQLAMRTGQYKTINASVVREGEIEGVDFITGEIMRGKRTSDKVVGYISYFKLVNGFEKMLYMSKEDMEAHASKYSQAYNSDKRYNNSRSVWTTNFDAMALKTVLKKLISKYGIMSIDMQGGEAMTKAMSSDQAVIREDGTPDYIDIEPAPATAPLQDFDTVVQMEAPAPETSESPALEFDAGEPTF